MTLDMTLEYRRGIIYFEAKDYISAARTFARVLAEDPANLAVKLLLARSYFHSAQLRRAEEELKDLLERDPADTYARLLLARTLQRRSRHDEAEPHLRLYAAMTGDDEATG